MKMKPNDVILHTVTKVAAVIIFAFAIYLYYGGHHNPGGGFIGGLSIASGITLLFLAFDIETIRKNIPFNFKNVAALGVLIAILTGMGSFLFDVPFLTQTFGYFDIPIFRETELATALIFDTGVALAVIGTAVTIILTISDDRI